MLMTRAPELTGQTVVVIGGSSGMGLETARRAREEGAEVILTGRNAEHLKQAAAEVGARETVAFDVTDSAALDQFFAGIGRVVGPADVAALAVHLMAKTAVTGATFDIDGGQQLV
jgi:NAD(P)-dependent dehydrogenase (short-subunit alcohol dehydrogenase family)